MLYPLKFTPQLKERIWGGSRLSALYNIPAASATPYGECWALSAVEGNLSVVENGELRGHNIAELIDRFGAQLLGERVVSEHGDRLPLLIKFIDAADNLSVQVHPDDKWAGKRHNCKGKNEMWYIVDAEPGAFIFFGFKRVVTREEYLAHLEAGTLTDILAKIEVHAGDAYFIPAGAVHAIGAGVVIAEIQQTSDITYRLFDWNRVDAEGRARELHTELAQDVIDYDFCTAENLASRDAELLVATPYFTINKLSVEGSVTRDYGCLGLFVVLTVTEGAVMVNDVEAKMGDTVLVPAALGGVTISGRATVIESHA